MDRMSIVEQLLQLKATAEKNAAVERAFKLGQLSAIKQEAENRENSRKAKTNGVKCEVLSKSTVYDSSTGTDYVINNYLLRFSPEATNDWVSTTKPYLSNDFDTDMEYSKYMLDIENRRAALENMITDAIGYERGTEGLTVVQVVSEFFAVNTIERR